jgi:geranylgeranyl pyrophosphate synthase
VAASTYVIGLAGKWPTEMGMNMQADSIASFDFDLNGYRKRANRALEACLPAANPGPAELHEAMRYAVLNGGKRVRATLVYATGEAVGADPALLDAPACAVELIHAYSLVHDDLPAMDDDDLRRGQATCHRVYGEANALLAGDALQSLAFQVLSDAASNARRGMEMVATLARASGSLGMAGGQAIDLAAVGRDLSLEALENMHRHKTGALIRASVRLGALCGPGVGARQLEQLDAYAACIGLAFQVRDDILDVEADTETLGKTQGADMALNKPTYPSLLGLAAAKRKAGELHERAIAELADFDARADGLRGLSAFIVSRPH